MTYRGHVKNGEIKLDEPARLPEGAEVNVEVVQEPAHPSGQQQRMRRRDFEPIEMPGGPLSDDITRDRR